MQNCVCCKKQMALRVMLTVLNLKPAKIAKELHISKSLVSKYLTGERSSVEIDIYLIQQLFLIQVKEYKNIND